ncbi:hypothetical protein [Sphingomonas quercus]|nr:hypothetical protein [Sphingomonas quercus]
MKLLPLLIALAAATPAVANSLVSPGVRPGIARSKLAATPVGEWNRLSRVGGNNVEVWTIDGDLLNKISFYGGIGRGRTLLRQVDRKRQPLPQVSATMLLTDIPALLETTYRAQGAVVQMSIDTQQPATLGTRKAIRFTYSFTRSTDEVQRKGEAIGTMVDGALYLVTYEAPSLYFFDRDIAKYRALLNSLAL